MKTGTHQTHKTVTRWCLEETVFKLSLKLREKTALNCATELAEQSYCPHVSKAKLLSKILTLTSKLLEVWPCHPARLQTLVKTNPIALPKLLANHGGFVCALFDVI